MFRLKAYEIPEAGRQAKGTALVNLLQLDRNEAVNAVIPIKGFEDEGYLIFMTKNGTIKKTELKQYASQRVTGLNAITLRDEDELISVKLTRGTTELIAITRHGLAIRFPETDVRDMGRTAMGVRGVTLNPDDSVIALDIVEEDAELLVISEKGFGKRTPLSEYRLQSRGGKGIKTSNITAKTGYLVGAKVVKDDCEVMLISAEGVIIRMHVKDISVMGRSTQGVTLMKLAENDSVVALAKIVPDEEC